MQIAMPLDDMIESEYEFQKCRIHVQTWTYFHSALSMVFCLLGIAVGILGLVYPEWHETLHFYRQYLAYSRRHDPILYWLLYKIFWISWIFMNVIHFLTIIHTIVGVQMIKPMLIIPQLSFLIFQLGIHLLILAGLIIISSTCLRITWISLSILVFFMIPTCTNLYVLVLFNRFISEKEAALKAILANTKQVHFKEK